MANISLLPKDIVIDNLGIEQEINYKCNYLNGKLLGFINNPESNYYSFDNGDNKFISPLILLNRFSWRHKTKTKVFLFEQEETAYRHCINRKKEIYEENPVIPVDIIIKDTFWIVWIAGSDDGDIAFVFKNLKQVRKFIGTIRSETVKDLYELQERFSSQLRIW